MVAAAGGHPWASSFVLLTPEEQFERVAFLYEREKLFGRLPANTRKLYAVGRDDFGLDHQTINSVRLRALYRVRRAGKPKGDNDPGWLYLKCL